MNQELRQHIEKIVSLTDEEFDFVLSHFNQKRFLKHQFLIQEGDTVDNDFFIINGLLKASHRNEENKEHILQFATEGSWITDPQAYHNQTKATLNIQCLEDGNSLFITLDNKEKLCNSLQKMDSFFRKKTTKEYILLQRRILCLISNNAKNRYEDLLKQYPSLIQRVPKTMIASYLGVSRETLSRLATS
ncbi:CRP-like cAMP-binding protein [Tenacibaculum adriaticum]|uniref:CRP-like cAMP-binding protein n=1 Tax=Tenacibaculum adriaticum TaxID=413713 RepID=A0A5S5DYF6_9FLAO|nr:Crp/Fnr family transcriptional regulator [Tenacibaculum adriaticum]TYQ00289.1 CRP-like cAMP-binding protein [Tenacibaculum adriaticum]